MKHDRGHVISSVVELLEGGLEDDVLSDVLDQVQLARRLEGEVEVLGRDGLRAIFVWSSGLWGGGAMTNK